MTLDFVFTAKALIIGLLTGLMSGGFGVGGGIVCTPLVRIFLDVDPHVAVGTTMALIVPTSIAGAFNYIKKSQFDKVMAAKLAPTAILGTIAGALATQYIHPQLLMILFALLVFVAGLDLALGIGQNLKVQREKEAALLRDIVATPEIKFPVIATKETLPVVVSEALPATGIAPYFLGLAAGLFAGFFGVGGGFLLVPCLLYFYRFGVKAAFGTSLVVIAAVAVPGTVSHGALSHVSMELALLMIAGSIPGSFIGSALALKLKDSSLRRGFGIVMLIMSITMAIREFSPMTFSQVSGNSDKAENSVKRPN